MDQDCINFTNSIETPDFANAITRFFDEYMALHNVVGSYSGIRNISSNIKNGVSIAFRLQFETEEDARATNKDFSTLNIEVFGKRFMVSKQLIGNVIEIEFIAVS